MIPVVFLLFSVARTDARSIADDPRLAIRTAIEHEVVSLSDLLREFSVKSGVVLHAGRSIADRKATIYSRGKSLSDSMQMLASTFGMEWKATKDGGFDLELTAAEAENERRTQAQESQRRQEDVDASLRELRRLAAMDPAARVSELKRMEKQLKQLLSSGKGIED